MSPLDETAAIAFRKQALLPRDDVLSALQPSIPHLTRSSLHRLFRRHSIFRLPRADDEKVPEQRLNSYIIVYFHLDICEVHRDQGKQFLVVASAWHIHLPHAQLRSRLLRARL